MNSLPPFARTLFAIFLGVPGLIMGVGGFGAWIYLSMDLALMSELTWRDRVVAGSLAGAVCVIGFLMITSVALMTGARRYRTPRERLPILIGFEILVLTTWMLLAGGVLGTVVAIPFGHLTWKWIGFDLAALGGVLTAVRFQRSHARKPAFTAPEGEIRRT